MTQPVANPATYPGKTLGIVGLIVSFFFSLIGLIISIIAFNQSKAAGFKNTPAKVGMILGIIFFVLGIVGVILAVTLGTAALDAVCNGQAPGTYETTNGGTITCP
jgi:ABC-type Na+ efflux pump permease subunit